MCKFFRLSTWALLITLSPTLHAQTTNETLPANLENIIDHGLDFLQKQQNKDGSFAATGPAPAITGLALLSFLSSGHTPDVGKYGPTVRKALDYLLKIAPDTGYYGSIADGKMYAHCIVTVALAEVYGTEIDEAQRQKVRTTLENCLKVIYAAQDAPRKDPKHLGGWRYHLNSPDADLSVTAWCLIALRASQNAGLTVPQDRIDRALDFILRCYRPDPKAFAYQPGSEPSPAMTAAALLCLSLNDALPRTDSKDATAYLLQHRVAQGNPYYYYSLYYTTQSAFQLGDPAWTVLWKNASEQLLTRQRKDGSWPKGEDPSTDEQKGRFYPTAMATLTLSIPLRLLPLYQR